jgi:hypothetical protein
VCEKKNVAMGKLTNGFEAKVARVSFNLSLLGFIIIPALLLMFFIIRSTGLPSEHQIVLMYLQCSFYILMILWSLLDSRSTAMLAQINTWCVDTTLMQMLFAVYLKGERAICTNLIYWVLFVMALPFCLYHLLFGSSPYLLLFRIATALFLLCYRMRNRFLSTKSLEERYNTEAECQLSWDDIVFCLNEAIQSELIRVSVDSHLWVSNRLPYIDSIFVFRFIKRSPGSHISTIGPKRGMKRAAQGIGESIANHYKNNPDEAAKAITGGAVLLAGGITFAVAQYIQLDGQSRVNDFTIELNEVQKEAAQSQIEANELQKKAAQSQIEANESQTSLNQAKIRQVEAETAETEANTRLINAQAQELESRKSRSSSSGGKWFGL